MRVLQLSFLVTVETGLISYEKNYEVLHGRKGMSNSSAVQRILSLCV